MTAPLVRPDWVVVGVDLGSAGVQLFASVELTAAELSIQTRRLDLDIEAILQREPWGQTIGLRVEMKTFVIIQAPNYAEAWECLFRQWQPHHGTGVALIDSLTVEAEWGQPRAIGGDT